MKGFFTSALLFLLAQSYAQIGKTYDEIQMLYPNGTRSGSEWVKEGAFFTQEKIGADAMKFIIFDKDSIVVGVSTTRDAEFPESYMRQAISTDLPKFKATKTATWKATRYEWDEVNRYLVMFHYQENNNSSTNLFTMVSEPTIIEKWIEKIKEWETP